VVSQYLLDTNIWILLLKQPPPCLRQRLDAEEAGKIATCSIVKAELWHGALKYQHVQQRQATVESLLLPYASYPFDDAAARHYGTIRHELETQSQVIGPNDLKIAAICQAHGLTLVTSNTDEFSRVAGLKLEDWTKA
jgi:tRNA(fMet)-specific endonuclease VapC